MARNPADPPAANKEVIIVDALIPDAFVASHGEKGKPRIAEFSDGYHSGCEGHTMSYKEGHFDFSIDRLVEITDSMVVVVTDAPMKICSENKRAKCVPITLKDHPSFYFPSCVSHLLKYISDLNDGQAEAFLKFSEKEPYQSYLVGLIDKVVQQLEDSGDNSLMIARPSGLGTSACILASYQFGVLVQRYCQVMKKHVKFSCLGADRRLMLFEEKNVFILFSGKSSVASLVHLPARDQDVAKLKLVDDQYYVLKPNNAAIGIGVEVLRGKELANLLKNPER